MQKYTIQEVKSQGIWVKCTSPEAVQLIKAFGLSNNGCTVGRGYYQYSDMKAAGGWIFDMQYHSFYIHFDDIELPEQRTIVGYRAPMDLFSGFVKKDDIYVKCYLGEGTYCCQRIKNNNDGYYFLPKEIVETWDPIYKTKYPVATILYTRDGRIIGNAIVSGHEGEFNLVRTDYGHISKRSDYEVDQLFFNKLNEEIVNAGKI